MGTYMLQTWGGSALPVTIYRHDNGHDEVIGGTLTLDGFGRYEMVTRARRTVTPASEFTFTASGPYTVIGNTLTFDRGSYTGTVSGPANAQVITSFGPLATVVYRHP